MTEITTAEAYVMMKLHEAEAEVEALEKELAVLRKAYDNLRRGEMLTGRAFKAESSQ